MSKPFYQSKVFWFNLLFILVTIATYFGFGSFVPGEKTVELATVLVSVINIILRFYTDKAVTLK
jgi:hypothetical protein